MVKMKMSTASDMCTLFCALIVCTLVSTARTANTTPFVTPKFDSEEIFEDSISTLPPRTTIIAYGKYGSKTTQNTLSVTDPNGSLSPYESVTDKAIDNSIKPETDYIPSDKNNSYTTEPMPTKNHTQSSEEPTTRVQLPITTVRLDNGSTTTPGTPSGTDLNDTMVSDDAGGSPTKDFIGNSQKPANKKYSSTEPTPTNDQQTEPPTREQLPSTTLGAMRKNETTTPGTPSVNSPSPKNCYNVSHKTYSSTEPIPTNDDSKLKEHIITVAPVTIRSKTKWGMPVPIGTHWFLLDHITPGLAKNKSRTSSKDDKKETTTTKSLGRSAEFEQWKQQQLMRETTTSNFEGESEESNEFELQRKILEMKSKRFEAILDILNSR